MTDTSETLLAEERSEHTVASEEAPWAQPAEAVAEVLEADLEGGLSEGEATRRRSRYGPNRLREHPRRSLWDILISQFKSLIIALLAAAAGVAFLFGEMLEGWAVMVVIVINTAIGFFTRCAPKGLRQELFSGMPARSLR